MTKKVVEREVASGGVPSSVGKVTAEEELDFILQAAVGPISVVKRLVNGETLRSSVLQTIDRDAYVRTRRTRNSKMYSKNPQQ